MCARRAVRLIGTVRANLGRLGVASVVMGLLAFALGRGVGSQLAAFALAGALGFGVGGLALLRALPVLGAPLASLVVETTAAVTAGALAWVWFDDTLRTAQVVLALLVLAGVVVGLLPYVDGATRAPHVGAGVGLALLAALAQAVSAVLSRQALLAVQRVEAGASGGAAGPPAGRFEVVASAAFDRLVGGLAVTLVVAAVVAATAHRRGARRSEPRPWPSGGSPVVGRTRTADLGPLGSRLPDRPWFWVGANALFGPVLGVTSLVWALQTVQPGVVQAVAATAPLVAIPLARWLDGTRPPLRYYPGAALAVGGLVGLALTDV